MRIREANTADATAIAHVHVASWRTTYQGIVPETYLANLSEQRRAEVWSTRLSNLPEGECVHVAEDETQGIVGFAGGGPVRDGHPGYTGELYAIYLLAEYQGRGLGRALTVAVARRLAEAGMRSMLVWVLADNPSRAFYTALGGREVGEKSVEIGGKALTEIAYGWDDVGGLLVAP
jgi:L-amino acid N-acyltransferase YncA